MRSFLLLALLTLCACSQRPGAGSGADSGLTMAAILKAAEVDQTAADTRCNDYGCVGFTRVTPEVLASRLNLAAFSPDPQLHGGQTNVAGEYRVDMSPSTMDLYGIQFYRPKQ